jgi:hypothetical protein
MSSDFKKFWVGQTISNLGSSFTQWAVPLLVYQLTHSAVSLGIATAATFLPYLLFGLIIGAWMDRVDRKRAMIGLDWLNALVILSIPLVAESGHLTVWWIYGVVRRGGGDARRAGRRAAERTPCLDHFASARARPRRFGSTRRASRSRASRCCARTFAW